MEHYIEIKIKPDAEMRENVLLNKVYTKFHKRLWDLKSSEIGISFPEYSLKDLLTAPVISFNAWDKPLWNHNVDFKHVISKKGTRHEE